MITGLNHVTFAIRNLDAALEFYRGVLGLRPVLKWAGGAYLVAGDFWIALIVDEVKHGASPPTYSHVAFSVEPSDFQKMAERIRAAGAAIWQENRSEGDSLYFLDPDGHRLEIHASDLEARLRHKRLHATPDMQFFTGSELATFNEPSL
jgi:catechol 2,3-dioxygenase-like lactoylglutathione lyase family enzyme